MKLLIHIRRSGMKPYLYSLPDIESLLKTSYVIVDSSAIIDAVKSNAQELFGEMRNFGAELCYIDEVLLEIYRTNNSTERTKIQTCLAQYSFQPIPHIERNARKAALDLQKELYKYRCFPSPTDIVLGACLNVVNLGLKTFILTSNISDFPFPIFSRSGYIIVQTDNSAHLLFLLKK